MIAPNLENERVKLSLLDLSNYEYLLPVAQEKDLIYYSPSDIESPEKLKAYVQVAVDGYYHKTIIPFLIYDKQKERYAGSTRFGLINWKNKMRKWATVWMIIRTVHQMAMMTRMIPTMTQKPLDERRNPFIFGACDYRLACDSVDPACIKLVGVS